MARSPAGDLTVPITGGSKVVSSPPAAAAPLPVPTRRVFTIGDRVSIDASTRGVVTALQGVATVTNVRVQVSVCVCARAGGVCVRAGSVCARVCVRAWVSCCAIKPRNAGITPRMLFV